MKAIGLGMRGAGVEDVQRRLAKLGYDIGSYGINGTFDDATAQAVRQFREGEGLEPGDVVDEACWSALVDATFELGDRSLYLKYPFFHGSDVSLLQKALNVLGFACGEADGILGAHTERALREFQGSVGIDADGIAGSLTFNAVFRLQSVWKGKHEAPQGVHPLGFSRASAVLESQEICVFGTDATSSAIASRIANLALATTPYSKVTSAESLEGAPSSSMLLVRIAVGGEGISSKVPCVLFDDDPLFPQRLLTAWRNAQGDVKRIAVSVPASRFSDFDNPTVRERQHVAVALLDALCEAISRAV